MPRTPANRSRASRTPGVDDAGGDDDHAPDELLERAAVHYQRALERALTARNYLAKRGLCDPELLERFGIGYGDGSVKGIVSRAAGQAIGLLNGRGTDVFYRSIVFPLRDEEGRVVSFYGRHHQRARHSYLKGPHRGLFNREGVRGQRNVVLAESVIDALSAIRLGVENVLPLYGVNGLTEDHQALLREEGIAEVTLLLDNDDPGEEAVGRLGEAIARLGVAVYRARLPVGIKDLNEYLVKGRTTDELGGIIDQRELVRASGSESAEAAEEVEEPAEPEEPERIAPVLRLVRAEPEVGEEASAEPDKDPAAHGVVSYEDGRALFELDGLRYDVRGIRIRSETTLRVLIAVEGEAGLFRDRPDLYLYRSRRAFAGEASSRLGLDPDRVHVHLGRIVSGIEAIQARELERLESGRAERRELTDAERKDALTVLLADDILERVARDLDRLGYVGETDTKKIAYLIATSRKTDRPLSCIVRSSSGAGKSRLIEMIADLIPPEDVELFSRITPQSLYYMGKDELAHKLLVIDERAGGEDADYSIRSLQTRRKLTLATPMRNPSTGKMRTVSFEVNGPVALMESTTAATINAENANRCYELYLDESAHQTRRVQAAQRRSYQPGGWLGGGEREQLVARYQNAQRLLRPLPVAIPFADAIRFPSEWIRTRRDHERFLGLIAIRAFLYQHKRPLRRGPDALEFVEATVDDYAEAYRLARTALASTLQDLSKPAQDLLVAIRGYVADVSEADGLRPAEVSFTRRRLREALHWPDKRLREALSELTELEELVLASGRNGVRFTYRLAPEPPSVREVLRGLSTPDEIRAALA